MPTNILPFLFYLAINLLFVAKYGLRFLSVTSVLLLALAYVLFVTTIVYISRRFSNRILCAFVVILFLLLLIAQYSIAPYTIQVDRWSAIHNWIKNLFEGVYPYSAQTHLGGYGSPFPVWQIIHIPFYLLGNVGLSVFFFTAIFQYAVSLVYGNKAAHTASLLLIFSPCYVYEIIVRSDLIANFLLIVSLVLLLSKYRVTLDRMWVLLACLCGMAMSTRLSALIPFMVYYLAEYFRSSWKIRIGFPLIALSVFVLTFLPFLFWDSQMLLFFEYNPFVLQSRQGHLSDFLLFIPLGLWLSLRWKSSMRLYMFNTAMILLCLVIVTFMHNMYLNNNWDELFMSSYDITYFNMSLPFLMLAMFDEKA